MRRIELPLYGRKEKNVTINTAIVHADTLRPNSIPADSKYMWINELEGKVADFMGEEYVPASTGSSKELLMPFPGDNIYELYLIAMYDIYNQDSALYQADFALFNTAFDEAKSLFRRNNQPTDKQMFEVM